eukprot:395366_1
MQTELIETHAENDTDKLLSKNDAQKSPHRCSTSQLIIYFLCICFGALISNIDRVIDATSSSNTSNSNEGDMFLGQQQLTEILNAAWTRILYNGEYAAILANNGVDNVTIDIADCLPIPELTPFPDKSQLKYNAKEIIDTTHILKFGMTPNTQENLTGIDTTGFFANTISDIRTAIVEQININYDITIDVQIVDIWPFQDFTELLNDRTIDILDQLNALGGTDRNDNLRRNSRLFSCSLISSGQYVMVNHTSSIYSVTDIIEMGSNVKICAGVLSIQLTNAYFPNANITRAESPPVDEGDIKICISGLASGEYDVYITIFPTAQQTQFDFEGNGLNAQDFRVFSTNIVAGTPYWIAKNLSE